MNNTIGPDSEANEPNLEIPVPPTLIAPTTATAAAPTAPLPWGRWLRSFLATNPFYLLSAALLLFGIYRISVGPGLFGSETTQLAFNFGSLQGYEILLVGTALLLARRAVWYDATLLACVENALLFVPFILVSQAALIEQKWVWGFCALGVALAAARTGAVKSWFQELNLPARALECGAVVLAVNAALPVVFRQLHESKLGTKPTEGAAYAFNEWSWLALLPLLIAGANLFPKPRPSGALTPQRRWLPMGIFAFWLVATTTHLYSLGYVYDFDLQRAWVAPALWALAWTLSLRITDFVESPGWKLNRALLIVPAFAPFVAGLANNKITLTLAALNAFAFGAVAVFGTQTRVARNLAIGSVLTVIAAIPHSWGGVIVPGFNPAKAVALAALAGLIIPALLSRNPKLGFLGACAAAAGVGSFVGLDGGGFHWAVQTGCVFLLLHSLRWLDWREASLPTARGLTAVVWVLDSYGWAHTGGPGVALAAFGLLVLGAWVIARQLQLVRGLWLVGVSGLLVLVSDPLDAAGVWVMAAPAGLLAVLGSLVLFGMGTAAALTKHRWHKPATE
jgi:hypothetical protein